MKKWQILTLLTIWAVTCVTVISILKSWHLITFSPYSGLAAKSSEQWTLTHVLSSDCRCSQTIIANLLRRGPEPETREVVVLLSPDQLAQKKLTDRGFVVSLQKAEDIEQDEHPLGVPFLLISPPKASPIYAGGYSEARVSEGSPIRDLEILNSLRGSGPSPRSLPVYGCATSLKYQKILDPLNIKYQRGTYDLSSTIHQ